MGGHLIDHGYGVGDVDARGAVETDGVASAFGDLLFCSGRGRIDGSVISLDGLFWGEGYHGGVGVEEVFDPGGEGEGFRGFDF